MIHFIYISIELYREEAGNFKPLLKKIEIFPQPAFDSITLDRLASFSGNQTGHAILIPRESFPVQIKIQIA